MVFKPGDLQDTSAPDKDDNNFFNITILDLDPSVDEQQYLDVELAWLYTDKKKGPNEDGISAYSTPIRIALPFEGLLPPKFVPTDLTIYQGKLRVNWQGTDENSDPYGASLKYVEVLYRQVGSTTWISAGTLAKAGFILISAAPKKTYEVKLVAVSTLGAAYATVTVFPLPTAELRVSTTVLVPEAVATEETGIVTPPLVTVKALASAVVVERFSL